MPDRQIQNRPVQAQRVCICSVRNHAGIGCNFGSIAADGPRRRSLEGEIDFHSVRLGGRHMMFHGKFDQFGITVYPERLHNAVFVKGDSAGRQAQNVSYFFH
jgi:hypothetical protein